MNCSTCGHALTENGIADIHSHEPSCAWFKTQMFRMFESTLVPDLYDAPPTWPNQTVWLDDLTNGEQ